MGNEYLLNFIDKTARLGYGVQVWHGTYVGKNTVIGNHTRIGSLVHIDYDVTIGDNCKIEGGAYIPPGTVIGDNVFIAPNCTITNDRRPNMANPDWIPRPVTVKDWAVLGAGSCILAGVVVHMHSTVGMGAVVTKSVPPYQTVIGNPARIMSKK